MAIYHLQTKPIQRSKGRSSIASSAYRSACKITDERTGLTHDYSRKKGVVESHCLAKNKYGDLIEIDRGQLWNKAEQAEKRKDARTAREIIINLPHELSKKQRETATYEFVESLISKYDVAIDYAIHEPHKQGDQRNFHAHIMMTTRSVTFDNNEIKLHDKTALELSNTKLQKLGLPKTQEQIKEIRSHWSDYANRFLTDENKIDHRSFAERNIEKIPTIKLGWQATALERKGIKTEKGDINRAIKLDNEKIITLKSEIKNLKKITNRAALVSSFLDVRPKRQPEPEPEPIYQHEFENDMNDIDALIENREFISQCMLEYYKLTENSSHRFVQEDGHFFDDKQKDMIYQFQKEIDRGTGGSFAQNAHVQIKQFASRPFFEKHCYMLALAQDPKLERDYRAQKEQKLESENETNNINKKSVPEPKQDIEQTIIRRPSIF